MKLWIFGSGDVAVLEEKPDQYFRIDNPTSDNPVFVPTTRIGIAASSRYWGDSRLIEIESRDEIKDLVDQIADKYDGLLCFSMALDKDISARHRVEFAREAERLIQKDYVYNHIASVAFQKIDNSNMDIDGAIKKCKRHKLPHLKEFYLKMKEIYCPSQHNEV